MVLALGFRDNMIDIEWDVVDARTRDATATARVAVAVQCLLSAAFPIRWILLARVVIVCGIVLRFSSHSELLSFPERRTPATINGWEKTINYI